MELFETVKLFWLDYYPVVVGALVTVSGLVAGALVVWGQIKPLFDRISDLKNKVEENSNKVDPLKMIQQSTLMTDLRAKLDNPTISDSLKLQYQSQLYQLDKLMEQTNSIADKVEDVGDKYL